jgi:hypothetical protein
MLAYQTNGFLFPKSLTFLQQNTFFMKHCSRILYYSAGQVQRNGCERKASKKRKEPKRKCSFLIKVLVPISPPKSRIWFAEEQNCKRVVIGRPRSAQHCNHQQAQWDCRIKKQEDILPPPNAYWISGTFLPLILSRSLTSALKSMGLSGSRKPVCRNNGGNTKNTFPNLANSLRNQA